MMEIITTTKPLNQNKMKTSKKRKFVINIERMKRWWVGQSVHNDKGGNFNVNLYIDYLNAISQQ